MALQPETFDYNRTVLPFTSQTSSGLGNLPAAIQRSYLADPQVLMAQRMAQHGADTSPVSSPLLGLVRALQGGLAGYSLGQAEKRYGERGSKYSDALTKALSSPDYIASLRESAASNPDLVGALISGLEGQRERQLKLQDKEADWKFKQQYEPDIAGRTEAAKNPALIDRKEGEYKLERQYAPGIEGAKANARNASEASFAERIASSRAAGTARGEGEAASEPVVYRGQPMTRAAAKAAMAAEGSAVGQGYGNSTVIQKPDVGSNQQTVKQANEATDKPSDTQRTARAFYDRAMAAEQLVRPIEAQGASKSAAVKAMVPGGNMIQSPEYQQYEQAKRAFIEAKLRKESGAAIAQSEYDSNDRIFFPQPGDSKQVVEQKRTMREQVLKSLAIEAGSALNREQPSVTVTPNQSATSPVNGGDPKDPLGLFSK